MLKETESLLSPVIHGDEDDSFGVHDSLGTEQMRAGSAVNVVPAMQKHNHRKLLFTCTNCK